MAYDAVISLILTLKQLVQLKPHWISDETRKMVDSVLESLEYFQDFVENTSKRRKDCVKVEELEREMKSAVNEAEDAIELEIYEINKLEKGNAREALCETLLLLVEKIDDMKRNVMGSSFGTNEVQGYSNPTNEDLQTGYVAKLNPESVVVGLEDDLMRIIRRLKGSMSTREIIPILGMGGIGKTTLAKMAYDDPQIRNHFDIHVWVTISQEYQTRYLLLGVVSCIFNEIKQGTDNELMDMIYKKLKGRRYLVVMDDIWSNEVWDLMSRTFPDDDNGSRIILTSRLKGVATHADPDTPPHEVSLLNADDSWKLLHETVFGVVHVCPPELEDIGKQVAQKCQGLPLALLVVAGHLSKIERTQESWKDVAKSVSKVVANESDKCLGVLAMSYHYLPNHLKPCFLYMGVFPEDSDVNIEKLINLWVCEGFLWEELVGRDFLEDLVSRNLIMVRNRRFNGEWKSCGVHDLVRDLILREAEKEKFLQVTKDPSAKMHHVCRYSFHSNIYQNDLLESSSIDLTRTMHFFRGLGSKQVPLLACFKLLRVLSVVQYGFEDFPLVITKLVHLRYLQLRSCDDPHGSLSELYNLQVFIVGSLGYNPPTIHETIWQMKHLRDLKVSHSISLPKNPSNKLQNLEGLSCLRLSSCTFELFSAIPNLKTLKLHGSQKECQGEKMFEHLNSLACLKRLEQLKIRCKDLYLFPIPCKYTLPTSLRSLTLSYTYLPWEDMANIVKLPKLEVLKIKNYGFYGDVWRLNEGDIFNELKFLLIRTNDMKQWRAGSVNFPMLQHVVLRTCIYLEEIPKDFGEIYTLESIELYHCRRTAANSVNEIQEEQESMGNDCLSVLIDDCR
uniref:Disease resistance protein BS2 n=1 Tax=Solanum tuberosum TaxID=4113 RepID=M1C8M7_SOLTU